MYSACRRRLPLLFNILTDCCESDLLSRVIRRALAAIVVLFLMVLALPHQGDISIGTNKDVVIVTNIIHG